MFLVRPDESELVNLCLFRIKTGSNISLGTFHLTITHFRSLYEQQFIQNSAVKCVILNSKCTRTRLLARLRLCSLLESIIIALPKAL